MNTMTLRIAAAVLAVASLGAQAAYPPSPAFSVKDVAGRAVDSAALRGKIVVVNFWATWCPPCRAEIPDFAAFYKANKAKGLEIVGFSVDELPAADIAAFAAKNKMTYPVVLANAKIIRAFDPGGYIPTTFIIDKQGRIRHKQVGAVDLKTLEDWFRKLAAEI
ncbi:MAG: TlpA disulfide reductase family protein [Acidobacteriota bacterium]|nr:TlpA disulfide reductase family protein [Acidobacteriota bacterium]